MAKKCGTSTLGFIYDESRNPLMMIYAGTPYYYVTNHLRYRKFYFNEETGLCYVNSRYYDPKTCRLINTDDTDVLTASLDNPSHDKNLFAYCDNNPVVRTDGDGEIWHIVAGAVIGAVFEAGSHLLSGGNINWKKVGV